jgi:hypothetical protein
MPPVVPCDMVMVPQAVGDEEDGGGVLCALGVLPVVGVLLTVGVACTVGVFACPCCPVVPQAVMIMQQRAQGKQSFHMMPQ